jgi:ribosomal protein L44E
MARPLRVAGEIDSWCTRCKLFLNHRVVSMKAGKAYQVECLTCRSQHLWRGSSPGDKPAPSGGGSRPKASTPGGARAALRAQAANRQEQQWEKATLGRSVLEFKPYEVSGLFQEGELVRHKKFGDGVVTRVIDGHKVEVLFRDEPRTLAQGLR